MIYPLQIKVLSSLREQEHTESNLYVGETRPDFSKVGNRVYTTMPMLPRVCLSVIGQDRSCDLKVWQYRLLNVEGSGRGGRCHAISSLNEYKSHMLTLLT